MTTSQDKLKTLFEGTSQQDLRAVFEGKKSPSWTNVALSSIASGGRNVAEQLLNFGPNIANLATAGVGAVTGTKPNLPFPEPTKLPDYTPEEMTPSQKVAHNIGETATIGALTGGRNVIGNALLGASSGTGVEAAKAGGAGPVGQTVAGVVAPILTHSGARVLAPSADAAQLSREGVTLTSGQRGGPLTKAIEYVAGKSPVIGNMVANRQRDAMASWNNTIINRALAPVGGTLPEGVSRQAAIRAADEQISEAYTRALANGNIQFDNATLAAHRGLVARINEISDPALRQKVTSIYQNQFIDPLFSNQNSGQHAQRHMEQLISDANAIRNAQNVTSLEREAADILVAARDEMIENFGRHSRPGTVEELRNAAQSYARMTRVREAADKSNADGLFSPQAYHDAITANKSGATMRQKAGGTARNQQSVERARRVLGRNIPQGPSDISLGLGSAAGGAALMTGAMKPALTAAAGGAAMYSPLGQAVGRAVGPYLPYPSVLASQAQRGNPYGVAGVTVPMNPSILEEIRNRPESPKVRKLMDQLERAALIDASNTED